MLYIKLTIFRTNRKIIVQYLFCFWITKKKLLKHLRNQNIILMLLKLMNFLVFEKKEVDKTMKELKKDKYNNITKKMLLDLKEIKIAFINS